MRTSTRRKYGSVRVALAIALCLLAAGCGDTSSSPSDEAAPPEAAPPEVESTVVVPELRAESARGARRALRKEGLTARLRRRYDDSTPKGYVIRQRPAGGEEVERGDTVTVLVSRGAKPAPEPEFAPEPKPEEPPTETQEEAGADCDPSYPDGCIPSPPPDLNCPDVDQQDFAVKGDDPHGFDADGDGVGCES